MNVSIDDIPNDLALLADVVGIDIVIEICEKFGGCQIYFPKSNSLYRKNRDNIIKDEFNGKNLRELSIKYKISETQIRNIIKK